MKRSFKLCILAALTCWTAGSAWALDQVDGVYQIGTAQDLADFANLVNSERQTGLNAVLTANIDFTANSEMVGVEGKPYNGIFDGQGYKVTVAYNTTANETALFRRTNGATIKNLAVDGTITTTGQFAGGIVSGIWQTTTIENCVTTVSISDTQSGDGTHGGIVARVSDKAGADAIIIRNCAFLGTLNAPNRTGSGGIIGWPDNAGENQVRIVNCLMGGTLNLATGSDNDIIVRNQATVTNCYYFDLQGLNNSKSAIQSTTEKAQSGELCFLLNGSQSTEPAWFQTLGTDLMPSPFNDGTVYAIGAFDCSGQPKGEVSYSNTYSEGQRDAHNYNEWGFCTECNDMQPDFLTQDADGYYLIGTKQQYNWFMVYANSENSAANARLTQDLDLADYTFIPIGNDSHRYHGTFDGQGFRVKNMSIVGTTKELGFFSVCSNATIKNLILDASCVINSGPCTGGLIGCCNGSGVLAIENVGIECDVKGTDQNCAAFVGCNYGGLAIKIKNCYNTGNVTGGRESAIFSGWFGNNGEARVENCWSTGKVNGLDGQNSFGRGIGASQFVNSYDLNSENNGIDATKLTDYTSEWLTNGKLTYILNGNKSTDVVWYQTIGTDAHPMLFGSTDIVYANGSLKCDGITANEGSELTFSNTEGSTIDPHQFADGFCTVCNTIDPNYMTAVDGYYEVTTPIQLRWAAAFSQDAANTGIKVKLMTDLNMDGVAFDGFGSNDHRFVGEIDGQRHIISNLKMEADREGVGLVNTATVGAKIKNLTMASTCEFKGSSAVAAFIGAVRGSEGELYIENCGNEGAVTASGANGAGFVGCKYDDNVIPCLTNCYNVGVIHSGWEGGSFSGWMPKAKMVNCYSIVSPDDGFGFEQGNQFARGWSIELTNCYDYGTGAWGLNDGTWGAAFADGRKIAEVNESEMGRVFAALYDASDVWRLEFDGWVHPVLYDPAKMVLSENVPNRFEAGTVNLTLKRTLVKDSWNTICLPFDLTSGNQQFLFGLGDYKVAELTGADGETLQFTTVNSTSTMTAGKAYLVKPVQDVTEKLMNGVTLVADAPTPSEQGGFAFTGIYEPTLIAEGDLFVADGDKLQPSDGEGKLKGFRAYFKKLGEGARATKFVIDGGISTGIIGVDGTVIEDGSVYTLGGQRVSQPTKGLYIVNGKKQVIK